MLLNEFLKEHRNVAEQQSTIAELKTTVAKQQKQISAQQATAAQQQKQIEALTATVQKVSDQVALSKPTPPCSTPRLIVTLPGWGGFSNPARCPAGCPFRPDRFQADTLSSY